MVRGFIMVMSMLGDVHAGWKEEAGSTEGRVAVEVSKRPAGTVLQWGERHSSC
jgi:hypothetical protein